MGDGRYYTYYQFFGVVILVLLSMFVIGSTVIGYYKSRRAISVGEILPLFLLLNILPILKIIEFVIPSISVAYGIRSIITAIVLIFYLLCMVYLNNNFLKGIWLKLNYILYLAIVAVVTGGVFSKGRLFIENYHFFYVEWSPLMTYLALTISLICAGYVLLVFFKKKQLYQTYTDKIVLFILFTLFFLPSLLYFICIYKSVDFIDFCEMLVFAAFSLLLNRCIYSKSDSGLSIRAFDKIGDLIDDYIFVADMKGKLIYRNANVIQSKIFHDYEYIDFEHPEQLYRFKGERRKDTNEREYIRVLYEEDYYYFVHKNRYIKDKDRIIGQMITVIDISEIINLLYSLEERKKKSKRGNEKLKNYSQVVYHVEKEKAINTLLEDILMSREEDMKELVQRIEELNVLIDDDTSMFLEEVDQVINFNQSILEEVRSTVSTYRQQYGG